MRRLHPLPLTEFDPVPHSLPRVERSADAGSLLQPGPWQDKADVLSLNLTHGCVHQCAYCCVPGALAQVINLPGNLAARLAQALDARPRRPRAVFLSPACDPFPPLAEVQAETCRVVEVLAERGVEAWLMTRGFIRPTAQRVLAAHRDRIKVTVGLTTPERSLQRVLEPLAASPRLRLRQIRSLRQQGINVQVEVGPLLPGLTDTRGNLEPLLAALAECGIRRVTASYAFLRPSIAAQLLQALEGAGLADLVLTEYQDGPLLRAGVGPAARYLPKARRQRGYAALMSLASRHNIQVTVTGLANPDFQPAVPPPDPPRQLLLPGLALLK